MSAGHGYQAGDCVTCGVSTRALKAEVEVLRRRLLDRDVAIVQLEAQMAQDHHHNNHHYPRHSARPSSPSSDQPPPPQTHVYPQGQVAVLRAQCDHWQDKYDRLLEAHKRLQKVNQGLEDKLLRLVDRTESEKSSLAADTANLTTALTTAAQAINRLKQENDRYRNDLNLAIQLLQCNPNKYAAHKLDSLPSDLQRKAKSRLAKEPRETPKPEVKVIKVPIPTFPPTAMVYSVNKYAEENTKEEPVDAVSAAIMAAVLEERQRERARQHCSTCTCGSPGTTPHTPHTSPPHPTADDDPNTHTPADTLRPDCGLGFRVSVVDVGTQVFPSYIGETGKVQSTCIYCHHSPKNPSHGSEMNGKGRTGHGLGIGIDETHPSRPLKPSSPDSAWDWAAEGQDSGSPSTPSSLVSASLSYESEMSNVTSPQESPGRVSHHAVTKAQGSGNNVTGGGGGGGYVTSCGNGGVGGGGGGYVSGCGNGNGVGGGGGYVTSCGGGGGYVGSCGNGGGGYVGSCGNGGGGIGGRGYSGGGYSGSLDLEIGGGYSGNGNVDVRGGGGGGGCSGNGDRGGGGGGYHRLDNSGSTGCGGGVAKPSTPPHTTVDENTVANGNRHAPPPPPPQPPHTHTTTTPHHHHHYTHTPDTSPSPPHHKHHHHKHHRLQFNARSPTHDVFTPPIHRSPPQRHRERERERERERSWSPEVIASSTHTGSSTETTL